LFSGRFEAIRKTINAIIAKEHVPAEPRKENLIPTQNPKGIEAHTVKVLRRRGAS
jgi:hypothetical protein